MDIKLKTVEEFRNEEAQDCLPKGIRAMVVGNRVIFVKWERLIQKWLPVSDDLQRKLYDKHVIAEQ